MPFSPDMDTLFFFQGMPGALALYEAFAAGLFDRFPAAGLRVQKTQITFTNPRVFACVSMLKVRKAVNRPRDYIVVTFGLDRPVSSPRIDAVVEARPGRWTHHVLIARESELDPEFWRWIQASYDFASRK